MISRRSILAAFGFSAGAAAAAAIGIPITPEIEVLSKNTGGHVGLFMGEIGEYNGILIRYSHDFKIAYGIKRINYLDVETLMSGPSDGREELELEGIEYE